MTSPISPNTALTTVMAQKIVDTLRLQVLTLGAAEVLYGDHNMIAKSPAIVVVPGVKTRELAGVSAPGGRTDNYMTVFIDVHTEDVGSGEQVARMQLDQLAERVEAAIHADTTLGGLIIHGFVNRWDPGTTRIANSMWRTVRMTYVGRSKTYLSA